MSERKINLSAARFIYSNKRKYRKEAERFLSLQETIQPSQEVIIDNEPPDHNADTHEWEEAELDNNFEYQVLSEDSPDEDDSINDVPTGFCEAFDHAIKPQSLITQSNFAVYKQLLGHINSIRMCHFDKSPDDADNKLCDDPLVSALTKRQFAEGINKVFQDAGVSPDGQQGILVFLQSALPTLRIPIHGSKVSGNMVVDLAHYRAPSIRLLTVSICPRGCCAYFASHSDLTRCPVCHGERFTHCTHRNCSGLNYDACKTHSLSGRVPLKTMHYRPLLGLVIELLETQGFLSCLAWTNKRSRSGFVSDLMDGINPKKHLQAMHENYVRKCTVSGDHLVEVNLILSLFYDGAQVCDNKSMMCTISLVL